MLLKIGYVRASSQTSGGSASYEDRVLPLLIAASQDLQFEIRVLNKFGSFLEQGTNGRWDTEDQAGDFGIGRLGTRRRVNIFSASRSARKTSIEATFKTNNIDLLWFPSPSEIISQIRDIPFVMTVWDLAHRQLQVFPEFSSGTTWTRREKMYQENVGRAFHVVTDSRVTGKTLEHIYGLETSNWSSIGLPLGNRISADYGLANQIGAPYFYYPANYWPHKNHETLLEAFKKISKPEIVLVMSGSDKGNRQKLVDFASTSGCGDRTVFLDRITDEEVQGLIGKSLALVMPSLLGPTNYPPLEALRLGVPAIVSDIHCFDEEPVNGLTKVAPLDSHGWTKAMNEAAEFAESTDSVSFDPEPKVDELRAILRGFASLVKLVSNGNEDR
jgi:glycosyltransferase involved in cell wall biosynthesis